jgi:hypothetical protein
MLVPELINTLVKRFGRPYGMINRFVYKLYASTDDEAIIIEQQ